MDDRITETRLSVLVLVLWVFILTLVVSANVRHLSALTAEHDNPSQGPNTAQPQ